MCGSLANDLLRQSLQQKGPRVIGQGEQNQNPTFPDWIKTVQGLKAGLFKPCKDDSGVNVFRADLNDRQVEISEVEKQVLHTFSMGNFMVPSIGDQQMELEARRTLLGSSEQLVHQLRDGLSKLLDFNEALKQSCDDLELDLQEETERSQLRNYSVSQPSQETRHQSPTAHSNIADLTREVSERQVQQPSDVATGNADRETPRQSETMEDGLPSTSRLAESVDEDSSTSSQTSQDDSMHSDQESLQDSEIKIEDSRQSTPRLAINGDESFPIPIQGSEDDSMRSDLRPTCEASSIMSLSAIDNPITPISKDFSPPISTMQKPIARTAKEKIQGPPFLVSRVSQGLDWDKIQEQYGREFGIWRTPGSLKYHHSIHKHSVKLIVLKIPPVQLREISLRTPAQGP
ncbi:hypothetical protein N7490_004105 [Penicillium lividum]|nr:hypothetical protein N7490_004105 [Penicillium lividum]